MAIYKSAMGKEIDMGKLFAQNETLRAVTNNGIPMNARGDIIDSAGNVVQAVTDRVAKNYNESIVEKTKNLRPRDIVRTQNESAPISNQAQPQQDKLLADNFVSEMTELEKELEAEIENDIEVEKMKSRS